jgi:hypothetical protein
VHAFDTEHRGNDFYGGTLISMLIWREGLSRDGKFTYSNWPVSTKNTCEESNACYVYCDIAEGAGYVRKRSGWHIHFGYPGVLVFCLICCVDSIFDLLF